MIKPKVNGFRDGKILGNVVGDDGFMVGEVAGKISCDDICTEN